jgi:signal transduction histidine kinase
MNKAREEHAQRVFEMESPNHETWLEVHIYPGSDGLSVYLHDIGERRRAADAHRLLMEMGTALTASLDYEETLRQAARIAVPTLADFCTIDLVGPNDMVQRVAVAAQDDGTEEELRRFGRRHPPDVRLPSAIMRAIRGGESILVAEIAPERVLDKVPDPELLRLVQELGARSALTVPLSARGKRLGVVTFVYARSGRHYTPESCQLAEDVARRIAIAIDNARLYEEAQESSRAKSNFISVMSHEFRTPLTAIVGYTDLLFAEVAGALTEKQKIQLSRIKQSAWHLTQLIEEVLTFSRVDAGREEVHREPVNMSEIAAKAATLIEPVAHEKNLHLLVDIPAKPLLGHSDPGKLRQILINLLSNAVKFTERGEVRLRVRLTRNRFVFQVEDTGIGIADENRERIFDSFWQVEQGNTRNVGGTGLGLTITRRLANLLGGDVDVVSQLGRGSTFTVWLPAPELAPPSHPLPGGRTAG